MFISSVTDRGAMPALVKTMAFSEARLKVIAENVANSSTPGYRAKQVDAKAFQRSLREALNNRRTNPGKPLVIPASDELHTDARGFLQVTPHEVPVENVLFHDGTNMSVEREMADLAETRMTHELSVTLLNGRFMGLRKAIRGSL